MSERIDQILEHIQQVLPPNDWIKFNDIKKTLDKTNNPESESYLWRIFYQVNPDIFYKDVLSQNNKSNIFANPKTTVGKALNIANKKITGSLPFGRFSKVSRDKTNVFETADKIIAASDAFIEELNLKNLSSAWDAVSAAVNESHKNEEKYLNTPGHSKNDQEWRQLKEVSSNYEQDAQKVFNNILKTRPPEFQVLAGLYSDSNLKRRDKRIKKYLFANENDHTFKKLNAKLEKLNTERIKFAKTEVNKAKNDIVKELHQQSGTTINTKDKSFVGRQVAKAINSAGSAVTSILIDKKIIQTPDIERQNQEISDLLADDLTFIREADKIFGFEDNTIKINTIPSDGKPLDPNRIELKDITSANIYATTTNQAKTNINDSFTASTKVIAEKSKRMARILGLTIAFVTVLVSVAVIVTLPPAMPFVIGINLFIFAAIGSFFYFNRDPISKTANTSKGLLTRFKDWITSGRNKKSNKKSAAFDMPEKTQKFLHSIDSEINSLLHSHFKDRAAALNSELQVSPKTEEENIDITMKNKVEKLENDWELIITAANIAADSNNKEQFCAVALTYFKEEYKNVTRPHFIELAKDRKKQHDQKVAPQKNMTFYKSTNQAEVKELQELTKKLSYIKTEDNSTSQGPKGKGFGI